MFTFLSNIIVILPFLLLFLGPGVLFIASVLYLVCLLLRRRLVKSKKKQYGKRLFKLAIVSVIFAPVFYCILFFWVFSATYTYSDREYSPDYDYYALVSENNGGATTGFFTDVMIVDARSLLSKFVLLSIKAGNGKSIFGYNGSKEFVDIKWMDKRVLKIIYSNCSQVYGQDYSWKDIKIVYEGQCSAN